VVEAARACIPAEARDRVEVEVPRDLPPVWADHDRIEQVFVNLLDNAIRHNAPGTRVWVSLVAAGPGEVGVSVRDDGSGEAQWAAQESRPERRARTAGAGLGLSIARAIVAAHGGGLRVEDAEPGLRFVVTLPAEPLDEAEPDQERAGRVASRGAADA